MASDVMISDVEKEILRKVALAAAARAMGLRAAALPEVPAGSLLSRPAPVFVTWRKEGRARGRRGTIVPGASLVSLVERFAIEALLHDPRVPPATVKELPRYLPEISVLSPFEEISGAEGLVPGTHGVVAEKGKRWGVVLPGDVKGLDWDAPRILSQACLRAGLPEESWKAASPPRLLRFTAEVF
ncbi:MAG: AMMECR1 domain-containing protein [Thermoanaerobaculia bacterium]